MTADTAAAFEAGAAGAVPGAGVSAASDRAARNFQAIRQQLSRVVTASTSKGELLRHVGGVVGRVCRIELLTYLRRDDGEEAARFMVLAGSADGLSDALRKALADCAAASCSAEDVATAELPDGTGRSITAVPVCLRGHPAEAMVALTADPPSPTNPLLVVMSLAAASVSAWTVDKQLAQSDFESRAAAALVELLEKMLADRDLRTCCQTMVDQLQLRLSCRQVVLGLCRPGGTACRLTAISGSVEIDARSQRVRAIEAAMDEGLVRQTLTVWPPSEDSERHGLLAHQQLGKATSSECVVSLPIREPGGQFVGVLVVSGDQKSAGDARKLNFLRAVQQPAGSCLALHRNAQRGRLHRLLTSALSLPRQWPGRIALALAALLAGLMAVPVPNKVKCQSELEPVTRRFVAAPFDGRLEKSFVEPGDLVGKDQLLARIDGREIRWELAGVIADLNGAVKQRDGHKAQHEFGEAQVAQHEVERLELKKQLLEYRTSNLEICSPIDGIVITGDLEKAEGVPLQVGQTLFEIGPLDRMIVQVAIPEDDIRHVASDMSVDLTLDAFPGKHRHGVLARIHPRSEIKDDENVFIGEMELDNREELLRPGMQGRARIVAPRRPLGWVLMHKPWDKLVFWLGW